MLTTTALIRRAILTKQSTHLNQFISPSTSTRFNQRFKFHSTRPTHNTQQQPLPSQHQPLEPTTTTTPLQQPQAQLPPTQEKYVSPKDILYHDPQRIRTAQDDIPGLRKLPQTHPDQLSKNTQFMATGSIFHNNIPSAHLPPSQPQLDIAQQLTRGLPELGNLNTVAPGAMNVRRPHTTPLTDAEIANIPNLPGARDNPQVMAAHRALMNKKELTPEQKQEKHRQNTKKLATLAFIMTVVLYSLNRHFEKKAALGTESQQQILDQQRQDEIDYTTRAISNQNNSVSPLAEEIIADQIGALHTAEDHFQYLTTQKVLPPVFQPPNALKLPLFVAKNPTHLQTLNNLQRHKDEMLQIYPNPPLNNQNVEAYLNDLEKMNRDYRLSHEESHVMSRDPRTGVQNLGDRIGFELNLRK